MEMDDKIKDLKEKAKLDFGTFSLPYTNYTKYNYGYEPGLNETSYVYDLFNLENKDMLKYSKKALDNSKMNMIPIPLQKHFSQAYEKQTKPKKEKTITTVQPSYQKGYRTVPVKSYTRFHPQSGKYITVKAHQRKIKNIVPKSIEKAIKKYQKQGLLQGITTDDSEKIIQLQKTENDWSHQSTKYPNVIGLTDKEIDDFIEQEQDKQYAIEYINKLQCLNDDDIESLSKKMLKDFEQQVIQQETSEQPYSRQSTIYITSPKGGHDIVSRFAYANYDKIHKRNIPFDLSKEKVSETLRSTALPYSYKDYINDVNDIVFLDDIFMSGEQGDSAYGSIISKLQELGIKNTEYPRIHYMPLVRNSDTKAYMSLKKFNTIIPGIEYKISSSLADSEASAVVFPYSIPDGQRHYLARKLYKKYKKFPHRDL